MKPITDFVGKIIQGDCLEVMREMPDNSVDLVITSPPYNLGNNHHTNNVCTQSYEDNMPEYDYQDWQIKLLNECYRICRGDMFYNHQHRIRKGEIIKPDIWINRTYWKQKQEIVWNRGTPNMDKIRFFPFTERIYWLSKENSKTFFENKLSLTDDWHISPVGAGGEHKRAYPIEIPGRIIISTNADVILDPFLGSGTTALAAERLGRKWIGIELEPKYCKIAQERIDAERAQLKLF